MELKLSIEHHDLEAAEALVSMSFWGQKVRVPRPLTPTSDSCDSIHLQPEGGDVAKDLMSLSSLVRRAQWWVVDGPTGFTGGSRKLSCAFSA